MDDRRKQLGKRLQRARRAAGYKSAKAFAKAINVSETSVARAESGSGVVAAGVFTPIETGLKLPLGISEQYLREGDEALLDVISPAVDLLRVALGVPVAAMEAKDVPARAPVVVDLSDEDVDDAFFEFIKAKLAKYGLKPTRNNIEAMRAQWEEDERQDSAESEQPKRYGEK